MTTNTVQVTLTDMAHGGDAVGRHEGQVIFVPLGIPGETVTVTLERSKNSYAYGRIVSVDEPSPDRVTPPCPVFGRCGGCQWQHIAYPRQLVLKRDILHAQLNRIGGIPEPDVQPSLGMDDPWRYRNHVQLRITSQGRSGYYALRSHNIVPTDRCPIAHPLLETMWNAHRTCDVHARELVLRAGVNTGDRLAIIRGSDQAVARDTPAPPYHCLYQSPSGRRYQLSGNDYYHERVLGRSFRVSAEAFFQSNTVQTERLVEVAGRYLQLQPGESLLDAYCGGGLLGLSLAGDDNLLRGIESFAASIRDVLVNAKGRGIFVQGDVAAVLAENPLQVDAIVLDPPRTGCTPETLQALAACGANRIVYVSCDPATLARDVASLSGLGYGFVQAQPVDLFPQTYHVETVALLARTDGIK